MKLSGQNIIGDNLEAGEETFQAINPATNSPILPEFQEATDSQISKAVELANQAFAEYRKKTPEEKAKFLEAIGEEILAIGDDLISRCSEETGLPAARLTGERMRTVNQLKLFATLLREGSWVQARIDTADPDRKPLPKPDIRSMFQPLGPVGVFGASNFPLAFSVAGGDTASALAAGCPVVVKAHPAHPGTSEMVGLAIQRAAKKSAMPEGVFSMLNGRSQRVGMGLVNHPMITAIGFTGSYVGGKALFDAANKRPVPIPVYAEMGSTNPVFILPDAQKTRKETITKELVASVALGVGQFCTNPGLVFTQSGDDKEFEKLITSEASAAAPGVMLTKGINDNFNKGVDKMSSTVGVNALMKPQQTDGHVGVHLFSTDTNNFLNDKFLEEEIFGPTTLLVNAKSKQEILDAAQKLSGHLTATIHATEKDLADFPELIPILETKVGRIIINGYPTGVEVCHSMVHGGPFPATSAPNSTSVGTLAINRFVRPVSYQNFPDGQLPAELKNSNPLGIWRLLNGAWSNAPA